MDHDHKHNGHGEDMEMGCFGQLAKRHGFAKVGIRPSIMFGKAVWREIGHAMGPEEREEKASEHQEQKPRIHESDLPVGITQTKPSVEVSHLIRACFYAVRRRWRPSCLVQPIERMRC